MPRQLWVTGSDYVHQHVGPMTLTMDSPAFGWGERKTRPDVPDPGNGRGLLEAYVCRGCGFVEWYCLDPESIQLGPEYMAQEFDCGGEPYR
jgi:hypothetical protein